MIYTTKLVKYIKYEKDTFYNPTADGSNQYLRL